MKTTDEAEKLSEVGNYRQAITIYNEILRDTTDAEEKLDIKKAIEENTDYYNQFLALEKGEAYFPVVDTATSKGYINIIKVVKEKDQTREELKEHLEVVKTSVFSALSEYFLSKNIKIFAWNFDDYSVGIKPLPHREYEQVLIPDGKSFRLAMAIALMSAIFEEVIPVRFVFTGDLEKNSVRPVDFIAEKVKITENYFESSVLVKSVISNFSIENKTIDVNKLSELIETLFPDNKLKMFLENIFFPKGMERSPNPIFLAYRKYTVFGKTNKNNDSTFLPGERYTFLQFCHNDIDTEYFTDAFSFIASVRTDIDIPGNRGIILSGLKPTPLLINYLIGYYNYITSFLALTYKFIPGLNDYYNKVSIISVVGKNKPNSLLGQVVYYSEKPADE